MKYISKSKLVKFNNDWAICNYGQSINGVKGIKDIDINVRSAWEITKGNENVKVAVIDSGVDSSCNILKDKLLVNEYDPIDGVDNDQNGFTDDYNGWNFYDNNNIMYENYLHDYHGTYVASTISKVAPEITILPVKFLKGTSGSIEDVIPAIKYAISGGADIINCSWNFNDYSTELYEVIKSNPNILFVCAAGNSNINLDREDLYPCSYDLDNIISVMSIDNVGKNYCNSGYGSKVDIGAPGVKVLVTLPENDETLIDGTSVSTAFVSGAAALLLSENEDLTPIEIREIIRSSARKLKSLNLLCNSEGCLDIYNCLLKCKSLKK